MTPEAHRNGRVTAPGTIRFERLLPGSISKAWAYLTESEKRAQWLAGGEIEPRVGGRVELRFQHHDLSPTLMPLPERFRHYESGSYLLGTVTAYEPPRLLAFTWHEGRPEPSEVIFELEQAGSSTKLTLTHRRLSDELAELANVGAGWHTHLRILSDWIAGRVPDPFFSSFEQTERDYAQSILPGQGVRNRD